MKNKEKMREIRRKQARRERLKNPEKIKARNLANNHIEIPKNKMCQRCNLSKATEKHHEDYEKPLKVDLVCKKCHQEIHGRDGILDKLRH